MTGPFDGNPNATTQLTGPAVDLAGRIRFALKALDAANGPVLTTLPTGALDLVLAGLDAARAAVPWVGNDVIREKLEEALA